VQSAAPGLHARAGRTSIAGTLALGTAQLGMAYGIANRAGPLDERAAHTILDTAWRGGIRYLDTAQAYGSEGIIGRYLVDNPAAAVARMRITTKLRPDLDVACADEIQATLADSRERLGRSPVWGMLLHREELLPHLSGRLGEILREWRARGRIRHLGVSVYTEAGMARALEAPDVEIIQAPLSPLDRRMSRAGLIAGAEAAGKKLFVRSVLLQGLIALEPREAARRLPLAADAVQRLAAFCEYHRVDRREFAIGYARHQAPSALLVIGAETPAQVRDNCDLVAGGQDRARAYEEWDSHWPADDPILVNPSRWPPARLGRCSA
jgi:aryl-alcohol dehydrogenase-like predicted oxidoreductase